MNDFEDRLREALTESAEAARRNLGGHPTRDELIAYHRRDLASDATDRLRDHLVLCPACRETLLCFDALVHSDSAERPFSEFELATAWGRFQERLRPRAPRWLLAAAAVLTVGIVALAFWSVALQRSVAELSQPQLNTPVIDLLPRETVYLGRNAPTEVALPAEARFFTLVLNSGVRRSYRDYAVEISRSGGRLIYEGTGLERNAFGSFTLTLARRTMEPGEYRIRVFGLADSAKESIGEYVLRLASR